MKKIVYGIVVLFVFSFFALPSLAQEGCGAGKSVSVFSPDPSSYEQISKVEAIKSKNYISSDQQKASVKPDSPPTKLRERR